MKWHAQSVKCSRATILRGYKRGGYAAQSPYQSLMLVLTRAGKHEIQGFVSAEKLKASDFAKLRAACRRKGIRIGTTRRKGRVVGISA